MNHEMTIGKTSSYFSAILLAACGVAACGGSDPGPVPALQPLATAPTSAAASCTPPPEGAAVQIGPTVMGGAIAGRKDPSFILVAPDRDGMLLFYGPDLAAEPRITGYVAATAATWCSGLHGITYNGKDRGLEQAVYLHPLLQTEISPPALSGTIRYASATYSLSGGQIPGSTYDVMASPTLADIAGTWKQQDLTFSVDAGGKISGSVADCPFVGSVVPDERINLFRLRIAFPIGPCDLNQDPRDGFAVVMPLSGGGSQLLVWAKLAMDDGDYADPLYFILRR